MEYYRVQQSSIKYRIALYTPFPLDYYQKGIKVVNSNSCVICGYSITDPVCRGCYIKQTKVLLQDLKISPIIKDFVSTKIRSIHPIETLNDAECVLCKKDTASLCRYCFSVSLIRILREINFPEDLIERLQYNYNQTYEDYFSEFDFAPKLLNRPLSN